MPAVWAAGRVRERGAAGGGVRRQQPAHPPDVHLRLGPALLPAGRGHSLARCSNLHSDCDILIPEHTFWCATVHVSSLPALHAELPLWHGGSSSRPRFDIGDQDLSLCGCWWCRGPGEGERGRAEEAAAPRDRRSRAQEGAAGVLLCIPHHPVSSWVPG